MRRPAVFFDRDNTLIVGHEYLGDPDGVKLVAGAAPAIAKCRAMGYATVVVSNQSGVARGMFDEEAVRACNARMDQLLLEHHAQAVIDRHEYCPFHPEAKVPAYKQDSFLRKPKPGMILAAADAMALDLGRSWVVGDAPRDVAAGKAAGCRTILIIDPSLVPSPAAQEQSTTQPDYTVSTLIEAIEVIAHQTHHAQTSPQTPHKSASQTSSSNTPIQPPHTTSTPAKSVPITKQQATAPATPVAGHTETTRTDSTRADTTRTELPKPAAQKNQVVQTVDLSRLELISQQLLVELKKANEARHDDFSISKLVAGIVQVLAVASLVLACFMYRTDVQTLVSWLLVAIFLQIFTVALLIMSRQK